MCTICLDFGNVPSVSQIADPSAIWVQDNCLAFNNVLGWIHLMTGDDLGGPCSINFGAIWIDDSHYLHWIGCDSHDYRAKWRICQFCSSFSNGPGPNPSPGASYQGALWMDAEFGNTHLAYIGCDGNKYLTGAGNYPYQAPY
jgi:hypothetical protein